jgi:hypothetical protein
LNKKTPFFRQFCSPKYFKNHNIVQANLFLHKKQPPYTLAGFDLTTHGKSYASMLTKKIWPKILAKNFCELRLDN